MKLHLEGKTVLVSGGSKGIGLACARAFAAEGCRLQLAARNRDQLEKARELIGGDPRIHCTNLRDPAALHARGSGVIVNVIGMAGEHPSFEYICGSTNAGRATFTKALGKGSRDYGVRVLGVHRPATRTERILAVLKAAAKANGGSFGHMIEPEQVGDTVAFLASPRAGQLSGVVVNLGA